MDMDVFAKLALEARMLVKQAGGVQSPAASGTGVPTLEGIRTSLETYRRGQYGAPRTSFLGFNTGGLPHHLRTGVTDTTAPDVMKDMLSRSPDHEQSLHPLRTLRDNLTVQNANAAEAARGPAATRGAGVGGAAGAGIGGLLMHLLTKGRVRNGAAAPSFSRYLGRLAGGAAVGGGTGGVLGANANQAISDRSYALPESISQDITPQTAPAVLRGLTNIKTSSEKSAAPWGKIFGGLGALGGAAVGGQHLANWVGGFGGTPESRFHDNLGHMRSMQTRGLNQLNQHIQAGQYAQAENLDQQLQDQTYSEGGFGPRLGGLNPWAARPMSSYADAARAAQGGFNSQLDRTRGILARWGNRMQPHVRAPLERRIKELEQMTGTQIPRAGGPGELGGQPFGPQTPTTRPPHTPTPYGQFQQRTDYMPSPSVAHAPPWEQFVGHR